MTWYCRENYLAQILARLLIKSINPITLARGSNIGLRFRLVKHFEK